MSWCAERLLLACGFALVAAAPAHATGELFTVAGTGRPGAVVDGSPATAAALEADLTVAALPGGGFAIGDGKRVRVVDASGRIRAFAGMSATDLAAEPDGSLLVGHCFRSSADDLAETGRVDRIAPDGTIRTVAGSARSDPLGDGGAATAGGLACATGVAALPGGGFVIADQGHHRVRRVDAGGTITTLAGTGEFPEARLTGSQMAARVAVDPSGLAVTPDGRVLIADDWACVVLEVRPDGLASVVAGSGIEGARHDDGRPAVAAAVCPKAVATAPDGSFLVADEGFARLTGEQPRVRRVGLDGRIATVAGTGRFVPNPPRRLERRGDGLPATLAELRPVSDISVAADGGVLIAEGIGDFDGEFVGGLIRYVAPPAPGLLAVAVVRDDQRFVPGRPFTVTVAATAPATVDIGTMSLAVPAGRTSVTVPAQANAPARVSLVATNAVGQIATDRVDLLPRGWLADDLARYAARGLIFRATDWTGVSGDALVGCRRFAPGRVDCALDDRGRDRCRAVVTIRLGADHRLRWGAYACPYRSRPSLRRRLRPFARADTSCEISDTGCVRLNGVLSPRRLTPWG